MCGRTLWWRIEPFLLTNAGFRHCSFWCVSLICWTYFSDVMVSLEFRKQTGSRPPSHYQNLFWCKFGFGNCFGASSQSNLWASHHWLSYKIHLCCMSQLCDHIMITRLIKKWFVVRSRNSSLLHRIREDNTLKNTFSLFSLSAHEASA